MSSNKENQGPDNSELNGKIKTYMTENSLKRLDKFKSIHSSKKNILNSTITTSRKTE